MKTKLKLQNIFNTKIFNPIIFLKENNKWFKIVFFVFLLSFIGGIVTYFKPELNIFYPLIKASFNDLSRIAEDMKNLSLFDKATVIFINNIIVVGFIVFGGVLLGILPLFIIVLNGLVFGFFIAMIFSSDFSVMAKFIMTLSLIPHGFIELYSVFTAASYSLKLGILHLMPKSKGKRWVIFIKNLKEAPSVIAFSVIGLMLAAVVEIFDMIILQALVK
jgi:stage II sporulation protein M